MRVTGNIEKEMNDWLAQTNISTIEKVVVDKDGDDSALLIFYTS
jgi:hypothetical protein